MPPSKSRVLKCRMSASILGIHPVLILMTGLDSLAKRPAHGRLVAP